MKKLLQSLFILMCIAGSAFAQNRTITGTVTDKSDNKPLPGVTIKVKGLQVGTQTSASGNYSLNVPENAKELEFSYLGYATQLVSLSGATKLDVSLAYSSQDLQELVVVAYGTQRKQDVVGSVSTVTAAQLEKQQIFSVTQGLQGLATGVTVINGSGQPGTNPTIRIRGIGSVNASSDPLIVLDGIPYSGSINSISTNDVESMTVLKDAVATSLYGSRAANGVIVITTKRGISGGDAKISAYSNYGVSSRAVDEYKYVSSADYLKLAWEAQKNYAVTNNIANPGAYASLNLIRNTGTNSNSFGLQYNPYSVANPIDANGNLVEGAELLWDTDWAKEGTNDNIRRKNVGFNVNGGSDKFRYYLSTEYLDQDGAIVGSNSKKLTTRFNGDANLKSWLRVGMSSALATTNSNSPSQSGSAFSNAVQYARIVSSIYPLYQRDATGGLVLDAAGQPIYDFGGNANRVNSNRPAASNMNAIALLMLDKNTSEGIQTTTNAYGEVAFTDYLKFRTNVAVDRNIGSSLVYANPTLGDAAPVGGRVTRRRNLLTNWTWNNMLTFDKSFGKHNVSALASTEAFNYKNELLGAGSTGFPLPGLEEVSAGATKETGSSSTTVRRIESYFSRASYNYDSKYYFEGSVRRDGSTRWAEDQRWGTFFSVGGSYIISNEEFMKNQNVVNFLKLRTSYGELGNDALTSSFPYLSLYSTGYNDLSFPGVYLTGLGNPLVTWEKQGSFNAGLDFGVLNNRLSGTIEYYRKNTFDLLFAQPLPGSSGVTSIDANIGKMVNYGFEFALNSDNLVGDFKWSTSFNIATVRNKITALPQQFIVSGTKRFEVGRSINDFWIYEWAGVDTQTGVGQWYADDPANPGQSIKVNQIAAVAANGTNPGSPAARRSYQGSSIPKVTGGLSNNFSYKGFDFSFLVNYALGGKILDSDYIGLMHGFSRVGGTLSTDILNRWTTPGQVTDVPALRFGNNDYGNASSRHLFSGDYLRLRNVTLGYTIPSSLITKTRNVVKSLRVFALADNYFTLDKLKDGADPEVGFDGLTSNSSSAFKTISFGLSVGF